MAKLVKEPQPRSMLKLLRQLSSGETWDWDTYADWWAFVDLGREALGIEIEVATPDRKGKTVAFARELLDDEEVAFLFHAAERFDAAGFEEVCEPLKKLLATPSAKVVFHIPAAKHKRYEKITDRAKVLR